MLLNVSNHPHAQWSEAQLAAAHEQFGSVQDLPFPIVPPDATRDQVLQIASSLVSAIRKVDSEHGQVSVLIAGEQGVLYHTVRLLHSIGFACFAATSERKVVQKSATEKSIEFSFVQFRSF